MSVIDLTGDGSFPYPSGFKWKKSDVSGLQAGRSSDTKMHKDKKAEKRTLSLSWTQLTKAEIHTVLSAFSPEYVQAKYWDPMLGADTTKTFYTGDMEADVKWWAKGRERYSSLSFDVIEV